MDNIPETPDVPEQETPAIPEPPVDPASTLTAKLHKKADAQLNDRLAVLFGGYNTDRQYRSIPQIPALPTTLNLTGWRGTERFEIRMDKDALFARLREIAFRNLRDSNRSAYVDEFVARSDKLQLELDNLNQQLGHIAGQ